MTHILNVDTLLTQTLRVVSHLVAWILHHPQTVVVPYLCLYAMLNAYPVDSLTLDLHIRISLTCLCLWDILCVNLNDIALSVLHDALLWILRALDDIRILQANLLAWT